LRADQIRSLNTDEDWAKLIEWLQENGKKIRIGKNGSVRLERK